MRRRRPIAALAAAALALPLSIAALAAPAHASPDSTPNGPYVQCGKQPINLNGMLSNEELQNEIDRLESRRGDVVSVEEIGRSVEGRALNAVTVGSGPRTLVVQTQIHGDEPIGTEAAVALLKSVSAPTASAQEVRDAVTLVVVPRLNPDGWERYNRDDWASRLDPRRNSNDVDLNRTFGPSDQDMSLAPEAVAIQDLLTELQPDLVLDYHHQVTYGTEDGGMATMSVMWGTHPDVAPEVADTGKRAASVIGEGLAGSGHAAVTLYPQSDTATTARNGLSMDGIPTLLIEQRGQQEAGQKSSGVLTKEALTSMDSVLGAFADGSFESVDPETAYDLPERGDRIRTSCKE
ncbi:M14 family metallopeptidase [Microbacterium halophytorum]|uniref:M14 family metallopeptidase n=1 Tax=Microbacterium halophytorum TaxID=2067568 RepID=UPI000CFDEECE|nr:M14 family metallopeptidase [Microbacterium halophytorum]